MEYKHSDSYIKRRGESKRFSHAVNESCTDAFLSSSAFVSSYTFIVKFCQVQSSKSLFACEKGEISELTRYSP